MDIENAYVFIYGEKLKTIVLIIAFAFSAVGCTTQGLYEAIQVSEKFECANLPTSQYDDCVKSTNKTYDHYQRERKMVIDK